MSKKAEAVNLRKNAYNVYIGRAGKGKSGYYGNPVAVGRQCGQCGHVHRTGASTLPCYVKYVEARFERDLEFKEAVMSDLYGKKLGCFCKPNPCHGDVLAAIANWANNPDRKYATIEEFFAELHKRVQKFADR